MSQLKNRIGRVEDRSRLADQEALFAFGGDVLLQDVDMTETEDGEILELPKGEVRRLFVMNKDHTPLANERVVGFEPVMITQSELKSVLVAISNTSRSMLQ